MRNSQTANSRIAKGPLLLLALLFFSSGLFAQAPVKGRLSDVSGAPLSGASVLIKGTTRGTSTNASGEFTITASVGDVLEFSMVGFQPATVKVGPNTGEIALQLQPKSAAVEEVIVIGYGTQKRASVTGAISSVNSKTVRELPVASVAQALQGRVAGVQVTNNGSPGTDPLVRIRGISSISYASTPLYVIDGLPTGDLSTIDTRDIETVDVLKDASAAAIYGSRATNGVIMITTKKGNRSGKLRVSLDSYVGTQNVTKRLDLLNTTQFQEYAKNYRGSNIQRLMDPWVNTPIYQGATKTYGQTNTDWQDEYFKSGVMTQHNIGLSGGNEVSRFYASAGYFDQTGIAPTVAYKRYNFRLNSEHTISKVFSFGENLYLASGEQAYDNNEAGSRTNLINVIRMMPHMPVYDPTTTDGFRGVNSVLDGGDPTNPVEDAKVKNPGSRNTLKVLGTAYGEVNFTKWLKYRSTFGIDYANGLDYRFSPIFNDSGSINGSSAILATITNNRSVSTVKVYTQQLTFDKSFGDHHINAVAVYEYLWKRLRNENASGYQASNNLKTLNNAQNVSVQTLKYDGSLISYVGRLNYDYKGKYLLNGAIRRDGLSVWAPGKKWKVFPSVSAGWRIDQETFMQAQSTVSELKVRGGYGVTGLDGFLIGWTPWQATVSSNSAYYPFGNSFNNGPASSIPALANPDLEWETTKSLNFGVDLGLLNNAITLSAEYFRRKTDNLILAVPLPPSMGYVTSTVPVNVASMTNNGFELQVGYNKRNGEFKWNASGNITIIKNNVTRLAPGVTNIEAGSDADLSEGYNVTNTAVGHPIQSFYGWQVEGIFQDTAEISKHATQVPLVNGVGTSPGDLKFKDVKADGIINNDDRTYLGSFIPKFTYSFNLGANYHNFDASVFFQGVQGNKIYNATRTISEGMVRFFNSSTKVLDAWRPGHTNTNVPRAANADPNQNARPSTRFLEDGSYLRLKNVMVGYTIPEKSLQALTKGIVRGFRIYVSAQNVFTVTKYTGYDPEVGNRTVNTSQLTNGIDAAVYPQPKAYQVGIQANF
ncbi:TonB-dependent receptor [Flavitalea sp. BT771]|uniref:SusC/RagA family TonB-linked outer membrane protein n=1 Tax=Flavitalea sp. BT771 TaxID=3063329 RepID=UPI0026E380F1|nr:TonB-dependent receptor [Flavitalea sp. BT771]MDO6430317.1 TonB-dependent receptor [Flavitalea sp. BT771]MDV6219543.1 TonB-dependent receptor [Flavitalea sp. BT771]